MLFSALGRLVAPPLGNSLASIASGLPFALWASLATAGFMGLWLVRERKALAAA
jgi:hypothetical protein